MKVKIKSFGVDLDVKKKGIEFDIREPNGGKRLGDMVLTNSGLTWCPGKVGKRNGVKLSWEKVIEMMTATQAAKAA